MDNKLFSSCHEFVPKSCTWQGKGLLICSYYLLQEQGSSFWGINVCMRLPDVRRKHMKSFAFLGFPTVFTQPSLGRNSPLLRVMQILRIFSKYCESLSFSQRFSKIFDLFRVLLLNTYVFVAFHSEKKFAHFFSSHSPFN